MFPIAELCTTFTGPSKYSNGNTTEYKWQPAFIVFIHRIETVGMLVIMLVVMFFGSLFSNLS